MSIIDTLITDRTQADVNRVLTLSAKGWAAMTAAEKEEFEAGMKGAYKATDLNRVNAAMEYLDTRLKAMGYTGGYYQRVKVPHKQSGGGSVLPEGYTQVEYIQSSGTQYVDTGFKPNQDTRVVCDVIFPQSDSSKWLFGARTSASSGDSYNFLTYENQYRSDYRSSREQFSISQGRIKIDKNKNITNVDGTQKSESTYKTFQCPHNLFLFANNNNGSVQNPGSVTLYSCEVYDNDTLIRDYIPCINPGGEVGLYDTVDGLFYGNEGTGTFTAGPEVTAVIIPSEPEPELDPYTWYKEDILTPETMEGYLGNVQRLRDALGVIPTTPEVPDSMEYSTIQEWNDIETILIDVEKVIDALSSVFQRAGMPWAVAGNNFYFRN